MLRFQHTGFIPIVPAGECDGRFVVQVVQAFDPAVLVVVQQCLKRRPVPIPDAPALRRRGPTIDALATDLWILTHPDLRRVARVRTFMRHVADSVSECAGRLSGSGR